MKRLKIILVVLIVILLTLISFVGIYQKDNFTFKNILADYMFSKNLKGSRVIELAVDTSTKEVKYDKDGNVVKDEDIENSTDEENENSESTENTEEEKYTTVDEPVNPQEILTEENYKTVKKIIEKRLDILNIADYKVKLNNENGKIIVEIPEDDSADETVSYFNSVGSFEIVDAEDGTVLLNDKNIKKVQVAYNNGSSGTTVYLTIAFDNEGKKKLEEISNNYTMITDENDNTIEKKVTLKMEDEELFSTYFSEPIVSGEMQLTVGSASTDAEKIQDYLKSAASVAMLLNAGKMPIKYTISSQQYIKPIVNDNILSIGIYVMLVLVIVSFIYLILKYKKYGALAVISSISAIDLLLLAIRYTNVYLSVESAIGFTILIIFNVYVLKNVLSNVRDNFNEEEMSKAMNKGILASIDMIVVMLIIAVVFTFMSWSAISSVGNLIFWGIISIGISHFIFTRTLLLDSNKE